MVKLIVQLPLKEPNEYLLTGQRIVIGRASDNEISIDEKIVSRRHAEIIREGEHFVLVDLDSHNGTFINDARITRHILTDQDTIRIGTAIIKYRDMRSQQVFLSDDHIQDEKRTLVKPLAEENVISPLRDLAPFISTMRAKEEKPGISRKFLEATLRLAKDRPQENLEKNYRNLLILYQIGEIINSVTNLEELLEVIMDLVLQVVEAERGFLLLRDEGTETLLPKVVRYRGVAPPEEKITLSRTIVKRVIEEQVAVLTADAKFDSRFSSGDSVQLYGIRSAMCVPLWRHRDDIIG
ncbi:MAG: FHA domain-containing protein, partial [Deltaproteobacteria bacterium]|nr:FHA domain-containing protein [Deltaproteobacteria bacterium]